MLVNGVEVFDKPISLKQALNVQKQINRVPEMEDELKTSGDVSVTNNEIEVVSPNVNNWSVSGPGFFEGMGSSVRKKSALSREQLYEVYMRMDATEFMHRGLEVISDEATQKDDNDEVIQIYSENEKIKEALDDLFYTRLGFDTELWSIVFETCKMGDNFYEIVLEISDQKALGIKRLKYLDPSKVEIKEANGKVDYYVYRHTNKNSKLSEQKLFPWQIVHFKIEDKENKPYGRSLLYSGVRTFNRLISTEDIFLTYVISRTPSRRVFKIDVGNLPPLEAQRQLMEIRDRYRSQQVIDEDGNLNRTASMFSITSDIFVPVREGSSGTSIELLGGEGMNMGQNMTFIDYFKNNLLRTLNIPPEYLGENSQSDKSTSLAQRDVKFARFIERVQSHNLKGCYKIASLHLFFLGFEKEDLQDFTLSLTPPSTIKEVSDIDVITQKINLIQSMQGLGMFPTVWMLKEVLKLTDKEINDIQFLKSIEEKQDQMGQQGMPGIGAPAGGMTMPMGGEMPPEGMGGEMPPAGEEGETPDIMSEPPTDIEASLSGGLEPPEGTEIEDQVSTFIKVLGKNYLVENKEDAIAFIKYIKEQEKNKKKKQAPSEFLTEISGFMNNKEVRVQKGKMVNPFLVLENTNEFRGINLRNKKRRTYSIYEEGVAVSKEVGKLLNG
jgi:hypothetical protein